MSYLDEPLHPESLRELRQLMKIHGFERLVVELAKLAVEQSNLQPVQIAAAPAIEPRVRRGMSRSNLVK